MARRVKIRAVRMCAVKCCLCVRTAIDDDDVRRPLRFTPAEERMMNNRISMCGEWDFYRGGKGRAGAAARFLF